MRSTCQRRFTGGFTSRPSCRDILGGVHIGVAAELTARACADKLLSYALAWLATAMTSLAGPSRLDMERFDSLQGRLVLDESLKLTERPTVKYPIGVLAPSPCSGPDMREVFQRDPVAEPIDGKRDDLLRDVVVHPATVPRFPARQPFQDALCAFRALRLQGCSNASELIPDLEKIFAGPNFTGRRDRQSLDPTVDSQHPAGVGIQCLRLDLNADVDGESFLGADERCERGLVPSQQTSLVLADAEQAPNTALDGRETDGPIFLSERKDSGVKRDRGRAILPVLMPRRLDVAADAANCRYGQVGRQAEPFSRLPISQMVQFDGVGDSGLCGNTIQERTGIGVTAKSFLDSFDVAGWNVQSALYRDCLHGQYGIATQSFVKGRRFLPGLKAGVSAPNVL